VTETEEISWVAWNSFKGD